MPTKKIEAFFWLGQDKRSLVTFWSNVNKCPTPNMEKHSRYVFPRFDWISGGSLRCKRSRNVAAKFCTGVQQLLPNSPLIFNTEVIYRQKMDFCFLSPPCCSGLFSSKVVWVEWGTTLRWGGFGRIGLFSFVHSWNGSDLFNQHWPEESGKGLVPSSDRCEFLVALPVKCLFRASTLSWANQLL